MSRPEVSETCENARALLSRRLDEPLPEIRWAALRAHLRKCPDCEEFNRRLGLITSALRSAPLEQPRPLTVPSAAVRRLQARTVRFAAAAAIAVGASAGLGAFLERTMRPVSELSSAAGTLDFAATKATQEPYFEQRLLAMLRRPDPPRGRVIAT